MTTYHIFHSSDLYEIIVEGTLVRKITRFGGNSHLGKEVSFQDLPEEVVEELLNQVRNNQ